MIRFASAFVFFVGLFSPLTVISDDRFNTLSDVMHHETITTAEMATVRGEATQVYVDKPKSGLTLVADIERQNIATRLAGIFDVPECNGGAQCVTTLNGNGRVLLARCTGTCNTFLYCKGATCKPELQASAIFEPAPSHSRVVILDNSSPYSP